MSELLPMRPVPGDEEPPSYRWAFSLAESVVTLGTVVVIAVTETPWWIAVLPCLVVFGVFGFIESKVKKKVN